MQRIDEMKEPPVVGVAYLVPTVRYVYHGRVADWPVIGPKHEDERFFDFPHPHYHLDARFIPFGRLRFAFDIAHEDDAEAVDWLVGRAPLFSTGQPDHPAIVYRRRKCVRSVAGYVYGNHEGVQRLRAAYADKPLVHTACGRACPHRGAPVDSLQPDEHGVITCPLHGLRFNAKTGEATP